MVRSIFLKVSHRSSDGFSLCFAGIYAGMWNQQLENLEAESNKQESRNVVAATEGESSKTAIATAHHHH